jgi:FlaA1/EpsC-like NDP-sugar epimerase
MGASKRVAELVVEDAARRTGRSFAAVRFGNVMGSNGSVVPRFLAQIKQGGPLTVTHPEMRRFFMLIPEAVELLLHSAALIEPGAIYVLEMGEQIRIADIAHHMARLAGFVPNEDIEIVYTGVRPGEKLSEELVADDERMSATGVEGIAQVRAEKARDWVALVHQIASLERYADADRENDLLRELASILPTFRRAVAKELAPSRPIFGAQRTPPPGARKPDQRSWGARSLPSV